MSKALVLLELLIACAACGLDSTEDGSSTKLLLNPVRVEVYLFEGGKENECSQFLQLGKPPSNKTPEIVRNSWADFESHGFVSIQIDHLQPSKKFLVWVMAIDPNSNEILGDACLENVDIEKGALREIQVVLNSRSAHEEKE